MNSPIEKTSNYCVGIEIATHPNPYADQIADFLHEQNGALDAIPYVALNSGFKVAVLGEMAQERAHVLVDYMKTNHSRAIKSVREKELTEQDLAEWFIDTQPVLATIVAKVLTL